MADIPRDPRQLARDILAGKVRIEDLAKERQRAGGMPAPPPRPAERMPDKIPLPNMGRPAPTPQARRPAPPPPPRQPPVKAKPLQKRPPQPVAAPPVQRRAVTVPAPAPVAPVVSPYAVASEVKQAASNAHRDRGTPLAQLLRSPKSLKQAILLSEILNKPVSMRDS